MREYIDFLGGQPPYDALESHDLERLARLVEVEYFAAETHIIEAGQPPLERFYVIRTGEVEVLDRGRVVDILGPGETFGHISVLSGLPPPLTIRALEGTLCYLFPDPRAQLTNPERLQFAHYGTFVSHDRLARSGFVDQAMRAAHNQMRPVVWCPANATIAEAARLITEAGQSCAVLDLGSNEFGIVTDSDFRAGLSSPEISGSTPVAAIASCPAQTISAESPASEAFLRMVECGMHHLVVTGAGERPVGVLRVVDLASAEVRNPLIIRRAIDHATSIPELTDAARLLPGTWIELFDTGVAPMHIAGLLTAVIDALVQRAIELTEIGEELVPHVTSWLLLGSVARREPLPGSDIDTALVWSDMPDERNPSRRLQIWAGRVLDNLELCGLPRCTDGANATNPTFARSQSDAVAVAQSWIRNPTQENALLLTSMIADSRPVTGIALGRSVSDAMLATTRDRDFLSALLQYTVAHRPPTGFVRNFVAEHTGARRGQLDLKKQGLVPIASLGRWVAVVTGDDRGSTISRLRRGADSGLLSTDESDTLTRAFEYLYGLLLEREINGLRTGTPTTSELVLADLDTLTRRYLREAFRAVADIQARLEGDWPTRLSRP
ncbi:putative nucleotidyltransferase substrate binding domain-containing protein [Gordonia rhizosphera]|uniref:Cyclic nucleotide-binding domain-containing protein n=1 Tax=Gordonia rhizosphera NBRC 16068 TaxID=1108045 RepID=K6W9G3_9ACTN|nr:putative nucleotidyltransferase substrate binding domain-containing protein [Gordonia rhizosphera]GAB88832.1 hypothetical protein GORHZ_045_00030 [Gordonia rhizosphera NBRC 16068]